MTAFAPKTYQAQVLDSIVAYFTACHPLPSPLIAFTATTERLWGRGNPYRPLSGFPSEMPYFCLRVPTSGDKTWLAAKSVATAGALRDRFVTDAGFERREVGEFVTAVRIELPEPSVTHASKRAFVAAWLSVRFWVRNLVRREGSSFFLCKANGRFYPDFLCQLPGSADQSGAILAVEYKGADRWSAAEDDRLIGGLWANLSAGRCRFVMVKSKQWDGIEALLHG